MANASHRWVKIINIRIEPIVLGSIYGKISNLVEGTSFSRQISQPASIQHKLQSITILKSIQIRETLGDDPPQSHLTCPHHLPFHSQLPMTHNASLSHAAKGLSLVGSAASMAWKSARQRAPSATCTPYRPGTGEMATKWVASLWWF